MKRIILCFLLLMMMAAGALADTAPVKMEVPPEAIETQAEGELETYGLTFPEDMPLAARNFVLFARAEFEKNDWTRLPKCNEYTQWYYHDKREIGWCSVFQIYCAYHSGLQLVRYKQDVDVQPDRIRLSGELPSPFNPPVGCRFNTRCRFATEKCKTCQPELRDVGGGHMVACHRCEP